MEYTVDKKLDEIDKILNDLYFKTGDKRFLAVRCVVDRIRLNMLENTVTILEEIDKIMSEELSIMEG